MRKEEKSPSIPLLPVYDRKRITKGEKPLFGKEGLGEI